MTQWIQHQQDDWVCVLQFCQFGCDLSRTLAARHWHSICRPSVRRQRGLRTAAAGSIRRLWRAMTLLLLRIFPKRNLRPSLSLARECSHALGFERVQGLVRAEELLGCSEVCLLNKPVMACTCCVKPHAHDHRNDWWRNMLLVWGQNRRVSSASRAMAATSKDATCSKNWRRSQQTMDRKGCCIGPHRCCLSFSRSGSSSGWSCSCCPGRGDGVRLVPLLIPLRLLLALHGGT